MNNNKLWSVIAILMIIAFFLIFGKFLHMVHDKMTPPVVKVEHFHTYEDGWLEGYRAGKYQAIDESAPY